jgi:hypothetical protein
MSEQSELINKMRDALISDDDDASDIGDVIIEGIGPTVDLADGSLTENIKSLLERFDKPKPLHQPIQEGVIYLLNGEGGDIYIFTAIVAFVADSPNQLYTNYFITYYDMSGEWQKGGLWRWNTTPDTFDRVGVEQWFGTGELFQIGGIENSKSKTLNYSRRGFTNV